MKYFKIVMLVMKDKILLYWNDSSYLKRSIMIYAMFSLLAIVSKLLDDSLGFISSMIAIGFLLSLISVFILIIYSLIMSTNKKGLLQESFIALVVAALSLFLMSLIEAPKVKETVIDKKIIKPSIHNVAILPPAKD